MAVTAKTYGLAIWGQYSTIAARRVDWVTDTVKVMLVKEAYVPNQDTDNFISVVEAQEITGTGYTAGGVALGSKTETYDAASNTNRLDAADAKWEGATFTSRFAVVYKDTGVAGTSPVLMWVDFGEDVTVSSGTFEIKWDATDGVLRVVVEA